MSFAPAVLVDPFESAELLALAELAGLPTRSCAAWPFDLAPGERVISTVPVPAVHAGRALGVVVGEAEAQVAPGLGEAWPVRTVLLEDGAAAILAHLAGDSEPPGTVAVVVGIRGGIGTTSLAATLARHSASLPLASALVDVDPTPRTRALLGLEGGLAWADLAGDAGPLLPHRLDAALPQWERVRVLAADDRGGGRERLGAALHALARTHELVVVDLGRDLGCVATLNPDLCVAVMTGEPADVIGAGLLFESMDPACQCIPAVRPGGSMPLEEVAMRLGAPVVPLGAERGSAAAVAHGVRPGDRPRGALMRAARGIAELAELNR